MKILNPVAAPPQQQQRELPYVRSLSGLKVAVLSNHWTSMDRMTQRFSVRAREKYSASGVELFDIPINGAMAEAVEQRVLRECDVAIVGLAN